MIENIVMTDNCAIEWEMKALSSFDIVLCYLMVHAWNLNALAFWNLFRMSMMDVFAYYMNDVLYYVYFLSVVLVLHSILSLVLDR